MKIFNAFKSLKNAFLKSSSLPQKQATLAEDLSYKFQRLKDYNTTNDIPQIEDFIGAYSMAVDNYNPQRWQLMDIYKNIVNRDAHLKAKMQERVANITNRNFRIVDKSGNILPITELLQGQWFSDFMYHAMQAKFYGYSLIEFTPSTQPLSFFVDNFDRRQVVIDSGAIVRNYQSANYSALWRDKPKELEGELYYYKTNAELNRYFFEVRFDTEDFGLLEVIACLCILKRHSFSSWDEFEQMFGVPLRIGKTPARDQKTLDNISDWLERMGRAAWAVFTQDTEIEIIQPSQTDAYQVFEKKIDKVDAQVSKLIVGSTLTSDTAANGNRSLGDIHLKTSGQIIKDDIKDMSNLVNSQLLPFLAIYWKFPIPQGCKFEFYEETEYSLEEMLKIDQTIMQYSGYQLDKGYLEQKYKVKLMDNAPALPNNPNSPNNSIGQKKKISAVNLLHDLHQYYETDCPCCNLTPSPSPIGEGGKEWNNVKMQGFETAFENLLKAIYNKEIITEELLTPVAEEYYKVLVQAVDTQFTADNTPFETEMQTALRSNTAVFAAAKSIDEQKSLAALLVGSDGLAKSFEEFKKEALQIHSYYKGSWLQAEYNYALRSVQTAKQWLQIEAQKDTYKFLRYQTVGDELVRESHRPLDGVTLPVEHPFWKTRKPPLDWNCRCYIEQVSLSEDNVEITPNDKIPFVKVPEQFQNNPAITKLLYNDAMPYFARANPSEVTQAENIGKKL